MVMQIGAASGPPSPPDAIGVSTSDLRETMQQARSSAAAAAPPEANDPADTPAVIAQISIPAHAKAERVRTKLASLDSAQAQAQAAVTNVSIAQQKVEEIQSILAELGTFTGASVESGHVQRPFRSEIDRMRVEAQRMLDKALAARAGAFGTSETLDSADDAQHLASATASRIAASPDEAAAAHANVSREQAASAA